MPDIQKRLWRASQCLAWHRLIEGAIGFACAIGCKAVVVPFECSAEDPLHIQPSQPLHAAQW